MKIKTNHSGTVEYQVEDIINFEGGLLGFESESQFLLIASQEPELPFYYLQSVTRQDLAFIVTSPFLFVKDYDFEISDATIDKLEIENARDVTVYSMTIIPDDIEKTSINLVAPILINQKNKKAKQVILDNWTEVKYYIFASEEG